jgi:hypothetical protein
MAAIYGDDKAWQKLKKRLLKQSDPHVRVGIIAKKGGSADHGGISVVELAAVHEFGAPNAGIPERSFIRRTFHEKRKELVKNVEILTKQVFSKELPLNNALDRLGAWGASAVKNTITGEPIPPPLKPKTIERKGSTRPLVDTGQLLNAITWEVHKK